MGIGEILHGLGVSGDSVHESEVLVGSVLGGHLTVVDDLLHEIGALSMPLLVLNSLSVSGLDVLFELLVLLGVVSLEITEGLLLLGAVSVELEGGGGSNESDNELHFYY